MPMESIQVLDGFLIGLRPWLNMASVLSAPYVAIGTWTVRLRPLTGWAATYDQHTPYGQVAALVIVVDMNLQGYPV